MQSKDYYQILKLGPSSTLQEVKKAYRKLALEFHPDKNGADPYAAARFSEIKEAYEVLSDPRRKDKYMQSRWLSHAMGQKLKTEPLTPVTLLNNAIDLDKFTSTLDIHRMDTDGLLQYLKNKILNKEGLDILNRFNEQNINEEIIRRLLHILRLLPHAKTAEFYSILKQIKSSDSVVTTIDASEKRSRQEASSEKSRIWVLAIIAIVLTVLIALVA